MIDNHLNDHDNHEHDNDHDTDSTISVGPEILSDIDMDIDNHNTQSPFENSDNESDSYEIITECQNQPNQPSINILNYPADIENADDYADGWERQLEDKGSSCGPFLSESKLNIDSCTNEPEAYFEALFGTSMWTTLAQEMNNYAWQSIRNKQGTLFHELLCIFLHINIVQNPR